MRLDIHGLLDAGKQRRPLPATVITLLTNGALRVVRIYTIFSIPEYHTLDCLYVIYPVSWILTTAVEAALFFVFLKKKMPAALPKEVCF